MNFALSTKYSGIDFEEMNLADVRVVGGGCGDAGGTAATIATVTAAAQAAAAQAGYNPNSCGVTVTGSSSYILLCYDYRSGSMLYTQSAGLGNTGTATVEATTGHVTTGGGFWSSVSSFFSWLFGSN